MHPDQCFLPVQVTVPYLRSEYGKEFDFDAPVKLLDAMMHEQAQEPGQQVRLHLTYFPCSLAFVCCSDMHTLFQGACHLLAWRACS